MGLQENVPWICKRMYLGECSDDEEYVAAAGGAEMEKKGCVCVFSRAATTSLAVKFGGKVAALVAALLAAQMATPVAAHNSREQKNRA